MIASPAEEPFSRERPLRSTAEERFPVPVLRAGGFVDEIVERRLPRVAAAACLAPKDLPEQARRHQLPGWFPDPVSNMLAVHRKDATGLLGRFHHLLGFGNGQAHRLFHVHVLTGLHGGDCHRRMPMVGRAYDHRVHAWVLEQVLVASIPFGRGLRNSLVEPWRVDVANRGHSRFRPLGEFLEVATGDIAQADHSDADGVVCASDPRIRRCCRGDRSTACKPATSERCHRTHCNRAILSAERLLAHS